MPSRVFMAMVHAAALTHVAKVLVIYHSDQSRMLHWHLSTLPQALLRLRKSLARTWFPQDGTERLHRFNEMAERELSSEPSPPRLVQKPKDVCSNLWCTAGGDCSKRRHLFQMPMLAACGFTRAACPRAKLRRPCPLHHCLAHRQLAGRFAHCIDCTTPWAPSCEDALWLHQGVSPQATKRKGKDRPAQAQEAVGSIEEAAAGWQALRHFVFALKVSQGR